MKKSLQVPLIANAQQAHDPRVADLVRAGNVRFGLFVPQYIKDPATGELKGVWSEIAQALATRIGVQLVLLEHATPPKAVECLKAGACDLLFLPFDARPPTSATSRLQFFSSTTPYWCQLAPRSAASPTRTDPGLVSRQCAITPRPLR